MLASVRLVWPVMRVGLLRRHLSQICTDSRQTLSFRYRLPKALKGIVQKVSQHGLIFEFVHSLLQPGGIGEQFEFYGTSALLQCIFPMPLTFLI